MKKGQIIRHLDFSIDNDLIVHVCLEYFTDEDFEGFEDFKMEKKVACSHWLREKK